MKAAIFFSLSFAAAMSAGAVEFQGTVAEPVRIATEASTGLEAVYVLPATEGVTMVCEAGSDAPFKWYRFSNLGGAYAEEIAVSKDGRRYTATLQKGDMGYMIEEGTTRTCYWVTDYSTHRLQLNSLVPSAEQDCDRVHLDFSGDASEIPYYSINGRRLVLSRDLEISYSTLAFDEDTYNYTSVTQTETLASIGTLCTLPAPLCDTSFTLTGDRFLRAWGEELSIISPSYVTTAVDAQSRATQAQREADNEQTESGTELGGSAPCEITFEAAVSDAAIFHEWQISTDPEFGINDNTFQELEFTYVFNDYGTTYVRFVANNSEGICEYVGPTYEIFIGESKLEIPNAFSPEASPGVNDEWKVSYKSLVSYECHIFNRWGKQLFESTDPSLGWDGKYNGKYVPSGVYFYVIKAVGADGIKYDKAGDINIIKYKEGSAAGVSPDGAQ